MFWELTVLGIIVALSSCRFVRAADALSPVRMFLYGWLAAFGCLAARMVVYDESLSAITAGILIAAICAFVVGARLSGSGGRLANTTTHFEIRGVVERSALMTLAFLCLGGVAYVALDLTAGAAQLLRGGFSDGLQVIRNEKWDSLFAGEVSVAPLRSVCIAAALIMATATPAFIQRRDRLLTTIGCIAIGALGMESFLEGGRFTLGVLCVAIFVSSGMVRGASQRRLLTPARIFVGTATAFYFFIVFPTQRNPDLVNGLDRYLGWLGAAHLSPWIKTITEQAGVTWLGVFAYATSYFSHGVDKLNFFITETDVASWYMLGMYNVPQASQLSAVFTESVTPWHQARLDIASLMATQGWALNPWATGIRDLAIDFGLVGAVVATFVFGWVSQRAYEAAKSSHSYFMLVVASYMSVSALTFAFLSPLQIRIISNGLWCLGMILLCCYVMQRSIHRRSGHHTACWRLSEPSAADSWASSSRRGRNFSEPSLGNG